MSRPDLAQDDLDALLHTHESRQQAARLIERHRYPAGNPQGGAFPVLGALLAILVTVFLFNVPALARLAVAYGPDVLGAIGALLQSLGSLISNHAKG